MNNIQKLVAKGDKNNTCHYDEGYKIDEESVEEIDRNKEEYLASEDNN